MIPIRSFRLFPLLMALALVACQRQEASSDIPAAAAESAVGSAAAAPRTAAGSKVPARGLPVLEILSEGGQMRDGMLTIDTNEKDRLWMGIALETEAGDPLSGQAVMFETEGPGEIVAPQRETDVDGYLEFQVLVGPPGTQVVRVSGANVTREFRLNVIPNDFDQWLSALPQAGLTRWNTLMETRVSAGDDGQLQAEFPEVVTALEGKTVVLAGFMLPLEPSPGQRHFLLSAAPPNCFFHVPGGPSTVVEVFADTPVPGSFDPLRVEGTLELVRESEMGILFRLRAAKPAG